MNNKPRKPRSALGRVLLAVRIIAVPFLLLALYYNYLSYKAEVTHSIENIIKIERGEYTHEIIQGFIAGDRLNLNIYSYRTDDLSRSDGQIAFFVYYNGRKLDAYGGGVRYFSFKMPEVMRGRAMGVALYTGEDFLGNIAFFPADALPFTVRPSAAVNDIVLTAEVRRQGGELRVAVNTSLPGSVFLKKYALTPGRVLWLQDMAGNIYEEKNMLFYDETSDSSVLNDRSLFHFRDYLWALGQGRVFYFEVPDELGDFKIVIPRIMYGGSRYGMLISKEVVYTDGPWEIPVSAEDIQTGY